MTLCVAVAALRLGRDLLIPLALALLMALLLSGIVETLRRYRVPRGLSRSTPRRRQGAAEADKMKAAEA